MAVVKLNISLDERAAQSLRRRAAEKGIPASRYLAYLIEADVRREQDALAEEGYRLLSEDTGRFARDAWPLAGETWPRWESENESNDPQARTR